MERGVLKYEGWGFFSPYASVQLCNMVLGVLFKGLGGEVEINILCQTGSTMVIAYGPHRLGFGIICETRVFREAGV